MHITVQGQNSRLFLSNRGCKKTVCHPGLDPGSHSIKPKSEMLKRVQHDISKERGFRISSPFEGPKVLSSPRLCRGKSDFCFVLFAGLLKGSVRVEAGQKISTGEAQNSVPQNSFLPTIEKGDVTFGRFPPIVRVWRIRSGCFRDQEDRYNRHRENGEL